MNQRLLFRPTLFGPALLWPSLLCLALLAPTLASCAADTISDRRSGQLIVCHKENKTLTVSNADSFVHLDHGDSPGPCPEKPSED
jgi:hypothetical protein